MYRSVLSTNWQRHREKSGRDWDSPKLKPKPTPPSRNSRVQRCDVLNEIERKQVQTDSPELRDWEEGNPSWSRTRFYSRARWPDCKPDSIWLGGAPCDSFFSVLRTSFNAFNSAESINCHISTQFISKFYAKRISQGTWKNYGSGLAGSHSFFL